MTTTYALKNEANDEIKFEISGDSAKIIFHKAKWIGKTFYPAETETCSIEKARFVWNCWLARGYKKA